MKLGDKVSSALGNQGDYGRIISNIVVAGWVDFNWNEHTTEIPDQPIKFIIGACTVEIKDYGEWSGPRPARFYYRKDELTVIQGD